MKTRKGVLIRNILPVLVRVCDLLAMTAIFGSGEVSWYMLFPVVVLGAFAFGLGLKDRTGEQKVINRILLLTLVALVIAAGSITLKTHLYPLIVATYTTLTVHALMWFLIANNRTRSARLLVGLVEVAVAAVLTPDLYIALIIFSFVVLSAIEISLMFLEDQLRIFAPEKLKQPLPTGFLFHSASVSVVVFLLSMLIFPILPRARTSLGTSWTTEQSKSRSGYTEQVNLGVLPRWSANGEGEGEIALRVYLPPELNSSLWSLRIPKGLLRGRVLDRFEDSRWQPLYNSGAELEVMPAPKIDSLKLADPIKLEIIREPLESNIAPVPYLTHSVYTGSGTLEQVLHKSINGSWFVSMSEKRRIQYFPTTVFSEKITDQPLPVHLDVPKGWIADSDRWLKLKRDIFKDEKDTLGKIDRLLAYFKQGGYVASFDTLIADESAVSAAEHAIKDPRRQLDVFLFVNKRGHCEYFASAAAFLLRMAGVPTRLVSGFRISSPPVGGVITVRQGDGHAWLEAWVSGQGWVPVDPTPFIKRTTGGFTDLLSSAQDYLSAYWYKYILSFDQGERSQRSRFWSSSFWKEAQNTTAIGASLGQQTADWLLPLSVFGVLAFLFAVFRFGFGFRGFAPALRREGVIPFSLRWRRWRANLWSRRTYGKDWSELVSDPMVPESIRHWHVVQERLRFGPVQEGTHEWRDGLDRLDKIWPEVKRQPNSRSKAA